MQVRALPPQATGAVPRRRAGAAILRGAAAQRLGRGAGGLGRAVLEAAVALRHAREVLVAEGLASAAEGGDHHLRWGCLHPRGAKAGGSTAERPQTDPTSPPREDPDRPQTGPNLTPDRPQTDTKLTHPKSTPDRAKSSVVTRF